MNHAFRRTLAALCFLSLLAIPALAHHSAAAEFDVNSPLSITGTITKLEWINPHIYLHVDVKDASGKVTDWSFEAAPPGLMHRAGVSRDAFVEGQSITVYGYRAKDGTKNLGWMRKFTFADGHTFEIWPGSTDLSQQR